MKILFNIFSFSENTHKVWYKNLWNWYGNRNLMIFDLLTSPQGHQFDPRMKILLHSVLLVIPFFDPLGTPSAPKPHPWAWPRRQNENSVWYVLHLSFVITYTKFGIKIFKIDFVIEIKWYLTFWALCRGQGKKKNLLLHAYSCNSHTKFGWISSNGLGGDPIMDRQTEGRRRLQYPLRFYKKAWGYWYLVSSLTVIK